MKTIENNIRTKIIGTGAYIPPIKKTNDAFKAIEFLQAPGINYNKPSAEIVEKFEAVTQIKERRLAKPNINASEMGYLAGLEAITRSGINKNSLDYIIVAHNWGDVDYHSKTIDTLPNIAAKIKGKLDIENEYCVAYDIVMGCPGWLEGLKQADIYIRAGEAKHVLVIGTETASRAISKYDRDSMLFSDGAGAVLVQKCTDGTTGVLAFKTKSHCNAGLDYLKMVHTEYDDMPFSMRMNGRGVFRYVYSELPKLIKETLEKAAEKPSSIKAIFMHQANPKMIKCLSRKLAELLGIKPLDEKQIPINADYIGNNATATIPILLYQYEKQYFQNASLKKGDVLVFASTGAGMHVNCLIYKV